MSRSIPKPIRVVNKDGSASYRIDVTVGYRTDRRRIRTVRHYRTRKEAQAAILENLNKKRLGLVSPDQASVGDFCQEWLSRKEHDLAPTTVLLYRRHMWLWTELIGRKKLADLRHIDIQRGCDAMINERAMSGTGVQKYLKTLRQALHAAVKSGALPLNPAAQVVPPRRERRRTTHQIDAREWSALQEVLRRRQTESMDPDGYTQAWYARVWIELILELGCRRGEALGLTWENAVGVLDERPPAVRIVQQLQKRPHVVYELRPTKAHRGRNSVPMSGSLVALLREHRRRQVAHILRQGWRNEWNLVFTTEIGKPWNPDHASHLFQRLAREANIPHTRLHDLRHANATWLIEDGVDVKTVQERLGHQSIHTTLIFYVHSTEAQHQQAARAIEHRLRGQGNAS